MARPLRIELAGGVYHLTSRGDRREPIYADDVDRLLWLELFGEVCDRFNWRCHAWCQMGNHYHLVVETAEANLSRGMRQLNGVYTQAANRRHATLVSGTSSRGATRRSWSRPTPISWRLPAMWCSIPCVRVCVAMGASGRGAANARSWG